MKAFWVLVLLMGKDIFKPSTDTMLLGKYIHGLWDETDKIINNADAILSLFKGKDLIQSIGYLGN